MTSIRRPANERGHANHGWLETHHSFSFAHYYDPDHMGYRSLRVINDDVIHPAAGFPMHGHRDMEVITYVLKGGVAHRDSSGGKGITGAGDVQVMTAGSGIRHSEYNASASEMLRLLQIWILPDTEDLTPGYDQISLPDAEKQNALRLIVAPKAGPGILPIHQDAYIYASLLQPQRSVEHVLAAGRGAWVQVATGSISVNGLVLSAGDGLALENEAKITIVGIEDAEFLLFDLL